MENTLLNLIPSSYIPEVHLSQYDIGRTLTFKLMDGNTEYSVPSGASVTVKATKPSGLGFVVSGTPSGNTVTIVNTETMTNEDGRFPAELSIVSGNTVLGTSNFIFNIERSPHPEGTTDGDAETLIPELTLLVERAEEASESVIEIKPKVDNIYPTKSEHVLYKNMIRENLVSFLKRNNFSSCVNGTIDNTDYGVVFEYAIGKGYMGIYGAGTFDYDDTETVSGTTYKVAYLDCSGFTSLITRGRTFDSSPYAYAFSHNDATVEDMFMLGLEDPDPNKNYTFDALNNTKTENFARIMNNSGDTLQLIKSLPNGETDEDVIEKMETGDVVFVASQSHAPSTYKSIYHCSVYVKTLEELNAIADGMTFNPIDEFDGANGYIVEVWDRGSVAYKDKLVIHTLDYWLNTIVSGTDQDVYMCKGFANSQNSNKQYSLVSGMYRLYKEIRFPDTVTTGTTTFPNAQLSLKNPLANSFLGGQPHKLANINIDEMAGAKYNGVWMPYNATDRSSVSGTIPVANVFYTLIIVGGITSGRASKQIFIVTNKEMTTDNIIFIRQTSTSDSTYGDWKKISITTP